MENCLAAIKANLLTGSTLRGAKRVEALSYPDTVYRELIVNACVHRNYSIRGSNIRIFLFQDRMEFISPGRLPNTVSIEKLPVGTSYARNPILVKFMENLGYLEKLTLRAENPQPLMGGCVSDVYYRLMIGGMADCRSV